jgi:alkanesulfonate monooxygenase SsuD/methylene tetrahydromethanopterin reductase-like flavin-dependent oxidoreductase (luciferase family)
VILCISDNRAEAVREAKLQVAFYGSTPNYRPVFEANGDGALTEELNRVLKSSGRDPDAMVAAVSDEIVERYAVAGTPDEVRDRLAVYEELVDHLILGGAWFRVPPARMAQNLFAILDTFGRGEPVEHR